MIGLLDGDIVVFRCGFAAERNVWHLVWEPAIDAEHGQSVEEGGPLFAQHKQFEYKRDAMEHLDEVVPGQFSRVEGQDYSLWSERELQPLSHALQSVKTLINRVCEDCDLNPQFDLKVYLSSPKNFRHQIATTRPYKGNRKVEHRPTYEEEIKDYIKATWDTYTGEDEEADDLMGIAQTKAGPEDSIIISLDKDLDQIPGLKYNFMHNVHYNVTKQQGDYNFCLQLMTGDTTDNIPGLPGIGPGKGAKALHGLEESYDDMMEEVIRQYQIHSGKEDWEKYLLEQGRLLWIRREHDQLWELPDYSMQAGVDAEWATELTLETD